MFRKKQYKIHKKQRRKTLPGSDAVGRFVRHHPLGVPIVTFAVLLFVCGLTFLAFAQADNPTKRQDARIVIISYDHHEQTVPSDQPTVDALIKKLQIPIHEGDVIEPSPDSKINQDDFRINIYRAVPVKIIDGHHDRYVYSAATTPRSITQQAGISTYAEDDLNSEPVDNFLKDGAVGETVVINRSVPVMINLYGANVPTRTTAKTVKDLLAEKQIDIKPADTIKPALDTPITAKMKVRVIRNGIHTFTETKNIAMPVKTINDSSLAYGTTAVRQHGAPGKKVLTYQIKVENGKEVSRKVIQSIITVHPVTQIVVSGTNLGGIKGDMALAGIAPSDYKYADYIISNESGWCPTKWQGEYGSCPAYHGAPSSSYVGYGLCQATPGYKMSSAGADWATNPVTQLKWCNGYAVSRHGSWAGAYSYWLAHHNW
ncbi:MAG TPA: G5 domain-containing protein [Candidatus Saccharimonadales bacterium]|nr:G5 domain-containing protein [Candidatus Saccharimonadales bacterium]